MKKIALTVGAVLALSLGMAPAALADDRDCTRAQREVARVELRLAGLVTEERNAERAALEAAQAALNTAQNALRNAAPGVDLGPLQAAVDTAREARDAAREVLNTDSRRLVDLRAELAAAIATRDKACDDTPPTTTPPTPAPTTTPAPADDVDCDEVSDARAQEILDADKSDPHNLDVDNDGVACEVELDVNPKPVFVPSGGVNTGGWRK
jgi:hypothetical protein